MGPEACNSRATSNEQVTPSEAPCALAHEKERGGVTLWAAVVQLVPTLTDPLWPSSVWFMVRLLLTLSESILMIFSRPVFRKSSSTMPQGAPCHRAQRASILRARVCMCACVCVCVCGKTPPPCSPSPRPHDILNIHTRTQIQTFVATARNPAILAVPCNGIQWDWVGKSNLDFLAQVDEHGCQTWFHAQTHGHKRREKMGRRLQEGPVTWSHSTQREAERESERERSRKRQRERARERGRGRGEPKQTTNQPTNRNGKRKGRFRLPKTNSRKVTMALMYCHHSDCLQCCSLLAVKAFLWCCFVCGCAKSKKGKQEEEKGGENEKKATPSSSCSTSRLLLLFCCFFTPPPSPSFSPSLAPPLTPSICCWGVSTIHKHGQQELA